LFGLDPIGHICLRDADIAARKSFDDTGGEHPWKRRREGQSRPTDRGADLRDDQDRLASDAVADVPPHGSRDELTERERREKRTHGNGRRTEMFDVVRQDRQQNAEPEDIDERDPQDREQCSDHGCSMS